MSQKAAALLTYKHVQHFWNGVACKFCGLKASQISKVWASCHKYLYMLKNKKIFVNRQAIEIKRILNEVTSTVNI